MGAGLFAVITIDYVGSELVSTHQWSFVGYLALYAAFVFVWGMPAIRRVQRARSARSWSRWPERVPL